MGPAPNIKCALFAVLSASAVVTGCASNPNTVASASEILAAGELSIRERTLIIDGHPEIIIEQETLVSKEK
jgi:hypothetical protein